MKTSNTDKVQELRQNVYVDNVITGTDTVAEAIDLNNVSRQIFRDVAVNLLDWMSNCEHVLDEIPSCDRANRECMKVLGLTWRVNEDMLGLSCQVRNETIISIRTVLRQITSVYDPP